MANTETTPVVAARLQELRTKNGLTIQEMAEKCDLPKRSLENYMNMKKPQKPGLEALVSIADAFTVSLDWLTGRTRDSSAFQTTRNDYAMACQQTVDMILEDMGVSEKERIGLAATSMLRFLETVALFESTAKSCGASRDKNFKDVVAIIKQDKS